MIGKMLIKYLKIFFPILGVSLGLLLSELAVRIVRGKLFDSTNLTGRYVSSTGQRALPRAQYHSILGWVPHVGVRVIDGEVFTILEDTTRSNTGLIEPTSDSSRSILAVGDSFTFGDQVSDNESWPAQLEKRLNRKVINGGVFAYGFDQIVLRAELLLRSLKPALLIVSFIPDDVRRCALSEKENPKPYFRLNHGRLEQQNIPVPLSQPDDYSNTAWFQRSFGNSHLIDFIMRRVAPELWLSVPIVLTSNRGQKAVSELETDLDEVSCALAKRLSLLQQKNLKILLVAQYEHFVSEKDRQLSGGVLRCAEQNGISTVDLYPALATLQAKNSAEYNSLFNGHMTAHGNGWIAKKLSAHIKNNFLEELSQSARISYR